LFENFLQVLDFQVGHDGPLFVFLVGAGLLAKAASGSMQNVRASSLASQLLRGSRQVGDFHSTAPNDSITAPLESPGQTRSGCSTDTFLTTGWKTVPKAKKYQSWVIAVLAGPRREEVCWSYTKIK
jgi:hypothetical protein